MSAIAGKTTSGKVWHVAVPVDHENITAQLGAPSAWRPPLCGRGYDLWLTRPLATVPAYQFCQHCERAVEQIAAAVAVIQT